MPSIKFSPIISLLKQEGSKKKIFTINRVYIVDSKIYDKNTETLTVISNNLRWYNNNIICELNF